MCILKIGDVKLGEGLPKICIPVMGATKEEILKELDDAMRQPCKLIEWRADYMIASMADMPFRYMLRNLMDILGSIKSVLNVPLIFTIRTSNEGGEAEITPEDYFFVNRMVADSGMADIIDIEAFIAEGTDLVSEFVAFANKKDSAVLLSNHDFEKTPSLEIMTEKYTKMDALGGDLIKLAVMPNDEGDVARLLEAADITNKKYPERKLIAISMGELGMSSRICAGQFGSVITFAAGKAASAPGQIDAVTLQGYLDRYYK